MRKLRRPVRLYVQSIIAIGAVALAAAPFFAQRGSTDPLLIAGLLAVATAANVQAVHISAKTKVTVGGGIVFASVLTVAPVAAMIIGAVSTFVGLRISTSQTLYNRLFNAAGTVLAAGAAALAYRSFDQGNGLLDDPLAIAVGGLFYYVIKSAITDFVIALQLRRDPFRGWWAAHRREIWHHLALYVLGVLAAAAAEIQPWTIVLFLVPLGLVLLALRETNRLRQRTRSAIIELADLIDQRDPYTFGHSQRVAVHAQKVAKKLRLQPERVELITEAARMHDIGKISTPEHILKKPAALNQYEWNEMRKHCEAGHRFLASLPDFADGAEMVLSHHERVDGTGYPRQLRGVELPVEASIIAVCDAYDAMTSDRVYRPALSPDRVIAELRAGRGIQWHEKAVDALLELVDQRTILPYASPMPVAVGAD
jgi:HD-GYP domain-containing protein (c-di-GMP phosphodiesterase class II)